MNLASKMRVMAEEVNSDEGLLGQLTQQAYDRIVDRVQSAAKVGQYSGTFDIVFNGYKNVYGHLYSQIAVNLLAKFYDEGFDYELRHGAIYLNWK